MQVIIAAAALGGTGLMLGLLLALASKYLSVPTDERIEKITAVLPNANCGGCGFAGCSAFAAAVAEGKTEVSGCVAGGSAVADEIAKIMGVNASKRAAMVAAVMCRGTDETARLRYAFGGAQDCHAAAALGGGQKSCTYGCLGFGSCAAKCPFNAISVTDGVAVIDIEKCTGCGVCVKECPKNVIKLIPRDKNIFVACSSCDKGVAVKEKCSAGCIACRICEKNCPSQAITVDNNIARIDAEKCTHCGICAEKCPKNIIINRGDNK